MSERRENTLRLGALLSPEGRNRTFASARAALPEPSLEAWRDLLDLANQQFLAPALWQALDDKDLLSAVPEPVAAFLGEAQGLNRRRNQRIKDQTREIVAALNRQGISPLVLKGAAYLLEEDEEAAGGRMMLDIDLLLRPEDFEAGVEVALGEGYRVMTDWPDWTYHYPPLARPLDLASLEIHRDAGEQRCVLPCEAAFERAERLSLDGLEVLVLAPTDRLLHAVFNAQIQDRHHELGRISLKQIYDLSLLCRHPERAKAIDWQAVADALERAGYGSILPAYLHLARSIMGLPLPAMENDGSGRHLSRCLLQLRWPWCARALLVWAAASHAFRRCRIDYHYGASLSPLSLATRRMRRGATLLRRHGLGLPKKLISTHRDLYGGKTQSNQS